MPSIFDSIFDHALDALKSVEGEAATLYLVDRAPTGTTSQSIVAIFNEFVGFVDDRRRAIFTLRGVDVTRRPLDRGDYFVLDGETDRWTVVDVRDDKAGGIEVRADGALERL